MKFLHATLAAALVLSGAAAASAQQSVSVKFHDGTVSLSAKDAPLRAILAEWARVGGATIVNSDRVPGGPVTLELSGVSEQEALDVLLRNVSGYIAAPRRTQAASGASAFDRILILPTSAPVSAAPVRAQTPPPVVFFPGDPDENPAADQPNAPRPAANVPPQDVQRQLREAAARVEARQNEARQDDDDNAEPEAEESEPSSRPGVSRTPATRPFGNVQGSSRPGVTTPQSRDDDDDDNDNRRRR